MIYDTFIFFNELDLLTIRLNILDDVVDKFVLVESTKTFQGKNKPLFFKENKKKYSKFLKKIIHIIVDDMPASATAWEREYFQRDAIIRGLSQCSNSDLIIISDLDEIPDPKKIPKKILSNEKVLFDQKQYYYFLNNICNEIPNLPCSLIIRFSDSIYPSQIRKVICENHSRILSNLPVSSEFKILKNSGWHFSYLGGVERIINKIEN